MTAIDRGTRGRLALAAVSALAATQAGIVSRPQVYSAGMTRGQVRAQLRGRRWRRVSSQALAVHTGDLAGDALLWAAVLEAGPRALLDGSSSLIAGGLEHFTERTVRVSVPKGTRVRRARGVNIRETRRWSADDMHPSGIPRTRNAVAAVRGSLWARSDKQAALILTMAVQQGLATAEQLGVEMLRIRRDRRRAFVHGVLLDLLGGVRALSELEFARECRRRGLPEPSRQVLRRSKNGRYLLDVVWEEWRVVVEIDGIQHSWAQNVVADALRQNDVTLRGSTVIRLPLLGLRVAPDEFFDQIEQALTDAGWSGVDGRSA